MSNETSLAIMERAAVLLAEANTIQKAKDLKTLALTAQHYAHQKKLGKETEDHCHAYAIRAEIKMGEMLKATEGERARGAADGTPGPGRGKNAVPQRDRVLDTPTLADMGLSKKESSQAKMLAGLSKEKQEEVITRKKSPTAAHREVRADAIRKKVSLPDAKYRVIYADPPWSYGNTQPDYHTEQRDHYPVMKLSEICLLPVSSICEENSVLFLWATSPILEESFSVIKSWGFSYKTSFVWDKIKHNMGHYNSVRHEFLLLSTRGSCTPDTPKLVDSVQTIERTEHSKKPTEFYAIIEMLYPHGKRIELFARGMREGWDRFGHQS